MKHSGLWLSALLPALLAVPAAGQAHGFVVFSSAATQNFVLGPGPELRLAAAAERMRPEKFAVGAGRLFGVDPIPGRLFRLGADLKEDASVTLGPVREIAYMLGADDRRVFVFFDNTLEVFDADLKSFGRVTLEAERRGDIVPVISPDGFRVFEDSAFVMASNTGDVFAVSLKDMAFRRLDLAADGKKGTLRALWVDPSARTLDVLDSRVEEEYVADGRRAIKGDYTQTFALDDPASKPKLTRLFEEREIHQPQTLDSLGDEERPEHIQYRERGPLTRREAPTTGVHIGAMSETNPSLAQVMEYGAGADGVPDRSLAVLRSAGRLERLAPGSVPAVSAVGRRLVVMPKEFSLLVDRLGEAALREAVLAY